MNGSKHPALNAARDEIGRLERDKSKLTKALDTIAALPTTPRVAPQTIERLMASIQKQAGGGRVAVVLDPDGMFFARTDKDGQPDGDTAMNIWDALTNLSVKLK